MKTGKQRNRLSKKNQKQLNKATKPSKNKRSKTRSTLSKTKDVLWSILRFLLALIIAIAFWISLGITFVFFQGSLTVQ